MDSAPGSCQGEAKNCDSGDGLDDRRATPSADYDLRPRGGIKSEWGVLANLLCQFGKQGELWLGVYSNPPTQPHHFAFT